MVKLYKPYVFFKAVYVISWPFVYFTWSTFFFPLYSWKCEWMF